MRVSWPHRGAFATIFKKSKEKCPASARGLGGGDGRAWNWSSHYIMSSLAMITLLQVCIRSTNIDQLRTKLLQVCKLCFLVSGHIYLHLLNISHYCTTTRLGNQLFEGQQQEQCTTVGNSDGVQPRFFNGKEQERKRKAGNGGGGEGRGAKSSKNKVYFNISCSKIEKCEQSGGSAQLRELLHQSVIFGGGGHGETRVCAWLFPVGSSYSGGYSLIRA